MTNETKVLAHEMSEDLHQAAADMALPPADMAPVVSLVTQTTPTRNRRRKKASTQATLRSDLPHLPDAEQVLIAAVNEAVAHWTQGQVTVVVHSGFEGEEYRTRTRIFPPPPPMAAEGLGKDIAAAIDQFTDAVWLARSPAGGES